MAADSMNAARRTPLIAAIPKMLFPFLVILPGLLAIALPKPVSEEETLPDKPPSAIQAGKGIIPAKVDQDTGAIKHDRNGQVEIDYDLAMPALLFHYFPNGMLGIGLAALLASFMSGMAGNVTAFNTVWTFDIYGAYIRRHASDRHYLWMGRFATLFGIAISGAAAYVATQFNNIMELLQLVFAFVNAPLFATFLLGMFWKRATGDGAFWGLVAGTLAAALHHGLTFPEGADTPIKGAWLANLHTYPSEMAQNFWAAIFAWTVCFAVTIGISLATRPRPDSELEGLVYSLTPRPKEEQLAWYLRPGPLGVMVLAGALVLNLLFL